MSSSTLPSLHSTLRLRSTLLSPGFRHSVVPHRQRISHELGRSLSYSSSRSSRADSSSQAPGVSHDGPPRWRMSPATLNAPVSTNKSKNPVSTNRFEPCLLEKAYHNFLGPHYQDALPSERAQWLSVTHKTFDQGKQGFNDRLSFIGKRIVNLQGSLSILDTPTINSTSTVDAHGRAAFSHPALNGLQYLTSHRRTSLLHKNNLAHLAYQYGLQRIIRWTPLDPQNLTRSGQNTILAQSMYAIIGAIALEKGSGVVNKVVQDRILRPLGAL